MADKPRWKSGVVCRCGGNIGAIEGAVTKWGARYLFECDKCLKEGTWINLAKGYFEYKRRSEGQAV